MSHYTDKRTGGLGHANVFKVTISRHTVYEIIIGLRSRSEIEKQPHWPQNENAKRVNAI